LPEELRRREVLGLAVGGGIALVGLRVSPVGADAALDVQILQTASSLEALAVAVYERVLAADLPPAVRRFATETLRRHGAHRTAFQEQTTAVDRAATVQDAPNGKFLPALAGADLSTPGKLVDFLATVEKVVTDTYLTNLAMVQEARSKALLASVMAVEAQHLAHLRLIGFLMQAGVPQLVADPFPPARMRDLPHTAGRVPFPDALHRVGGPELVAEPSSGAVR
jgi:CheY-like chemotaxis protein